MPQPIECVCVCVPWCCVLAIKTEMSPRLTWRIFIACGGASHKQTKNCEKKKEKIETETEKNLRHGEIRKCLILRFLGFHIIVITILIALNFNWS